MLLVNTSIKMVTSIVVHCSEVGIVPKDSNKILVHALEKMDWHQ